MTWEDDFRKFLKSLDAKKPVIICGDLNVAHEEIDIKNPKTNRRNAGFTDEEREKMTVLLNDGFTDSFRYLHPDEVTYSWWSYRFKAREKNAGWRIDYFLVSDRIKEQITEAKIHTEIMGSDHCPVEVDLTFYSYLSSNSNKNNQKRVNHKFMIHPLLVVGKYRS